LAAIGLSLASQAGHQLWTLNSVAIPDGVDDLAVRRALLADFNLEIGGGLGPMKGKVWRIGLMGESSTATNVRLALHALETVLPRCGYAIQAGDAVAAASRALNAS
jgi:alanine-glyoxylate transaminase/serine-glyoxylate transaminase/serine-pyruvate transaminase